MTSFAAFIEEFRQTGFLHHAVLIEGAGEQALVKVRDFVAQELEIAMLGNPDVFVFESDSLGIDEARELRRRQEMRAFGSTTLTTGGPPLKIFIVVVQTVTSEAQNALLKTLEEPTVGTHLFFIVPHAEALLPTLRSRMTIVQIPEVRKQSDASNLAKTFLDAQTIAQRMRLLKPILDAKDKAEAVRFFDALIRLLRNANTLTSEGTPQTLTELLRFRGYLAGRSPSVKLILEHVVGMVPMV
jgi:hypothetical protein